VPPRRLRACEESRFRGFSRRTSGRRADLLTTAIHPGADSWPARFRGIARYPTPRLIKEFVMTATGLIIFLVIGAIAGWLAGLIVRGFGFGLLGNIVVGIIGAFLAGWLLPALGVGFSLGSPIVTSIVYAMIGAIVLLVIIGLIKRA
jgi:uncharacterized membrane protein YeaQ/YmgE (transglycosylase-associated protein family)